MSMSRKEEIRRILDFGEGCDVSTGYVDMSPENTEDAEITKALRETLYFGAPWAYGYFESTSVSFGDVGWKLIPLNKKPLDVLYRQGVLTIYFTSNTADNVLLTILFFQLSETFTMNIKKINIVADVFKDKFKRLRIITDFALRNDKNYSKRILEMLSFSGKKPATVQIGDEIFII